VRKRNEKNGEAMKPARTASGWTGTAEGNEAVRVIMTALATAAITIAAVGAAGPAHASPGPYGEGPPDQGRDAYLHCLAYRNVPVTAPDTAVLAGRFAYLESNRGLPPSTVTNELMSNFQVTFHTAAVTFVCATSAQPF
jgi:hypothetical protein